LIKSNSTIFTTITQSHFDILGAIIGQARRDLPRRICANHLASAGMKMVFGTVAEEGGSNH
jgi:hypothetical protein